jgi:hypothetical protein
MKRPRLEYCGNGSSKSEIVTVEQQGAGEAATLVEAGARVRILCKSEDQMEFCPDRGLVDVVWISGDSALQTASISRKAASDVARAAWNGDFKWIRDRYAWQEASSVKQKHFEGENRMDAGQTLDAAEREDQLVYEASRIAFDHGEVWPSQLCGLLKISLTEAEHVIGILKGRGVVDGHWKVAGHSSERHGAGRLRRKISKKEPKAIPAPPRQIRFRRNDHELGEFSRELVPEMLQKRAILRTDYFWCQGMPNWELVASGWPDVPAQPPRISSRRLAFWLTGGYLALVAILTLWTQQSKKESNVEKSTTEQAEGSQAGPLSPVADLNREPSKGIVPTSKTNAGIVSGESAIPQNPLPSARATDGNLRAIYSDAPLRRAETDRAVSGSSVPVRVNNSTEAPRLESILRKAGWESPTVTEGVRLSTPDGFTFRLEVIDGSARDWYVAIETDRSLSTGRVVTKSRNSPW